MVNFVEQATMRVRNESTTTLRKINRELNKVLATGRKLGNMRIKLNGVSETVDRAKRVDRVLSKLAKRKTISTRISAPGAANVAKQAERVTTAINKIPRTKTATVRLEYKAGAAPAVPSPVPGVAPPRAPRAPASRNGNVASRALQRAFSNSLSRLGLQIEGAIIRGFQQAATQRDVASSSLQLLNLSPEAMAQTNASIREIDAANPQFDEGQIRGVMAEVLRTTRFDQDSADILTAQAVELARLQVLQGENAKQAIDSAFEFVKAAEQSGNVTDADGNFSQEVSDLFFDTLKKNMVGGGREITAQLVRTLTKSLRVARFGLDERGFSTAIALAEEQGSTAGVGLNQAIKQLSGQGQAKFRVARLRDLGLLTTEEIVTGTEGGRPVTETVADQPLDNDLLRRRPAQWVRENLIPALEAEGLDTSDAAAVSKAVNDIVGNRTAVETVTALILRSDELKKQGDLVEGIDVSSKRLRGIEETSTVTAVTNAQAGFTNLLGAAAESLEGVFIPALNKAGSIVDGLASFLSGPTGEGSAGRSATVLGVGAVATGAVAVGGFKLASLINPFNRSATALTGSATQLNAAAAALQRSAGAQGLAGQGVGPRRTGGGTSGARVRTPGVGLLGFGTLGLLMLDPESTRGSFAKAGESLSTAIDTSLPPMIANVLNADKRAKTEQEETIAAAKARGATVDFNYGGFGTRMIDALRGTPAPPKLVITEPINIETGKPGLPRDEDKIDRLLGLLDRNFQRMQQPGRSEAALNNFALQQQSNIEKITAAGGTEVDFAEFFAASDTLPTELEMAFGSGADNIKQVGQVIDDAGAAFGPAVGQALLAIAPAMGQAIGASLQSAASGIRVGVDRTPPQRQTPRLRDTGAFAPGPF